MEREKLFTIGQFAALHNINKKTLMWYNEIGLFKPAVVRENGYRYYTYYQSSTLETILMLRELDMSIPDIRDFLEHPSMEAYVQLLNGKIEDVNRGISRLKAVRSVLMSQCSAFSDIIQTDLDGIEIVEREMEYLYVVASDEKRSMEDEIEDMVEAVKKHDLKNLHDTTYGSLISVSHLLRGEFEQYDGLFMRAPKSMPRGDLPVKPGGKYLRAYCKGAWDRLPQRYQDILSYAERTGLTLRGYAYETGINEMAIKSIDEYITLIEIAIAE